MNLDNLIADAAVEMIRNEKAAMQAEVDKKGWHVVHLFRRAADKARERVRRLAEQKESGEGSVG